MRYFHLASLLALTLVSVSTASPIPSEEQGPPAWRKVIPAPAGVTGPDWKRDDGIVDDGPPAWKRDNDDGVTGPDWKRSVSDGVTGPDWRRDGKAGAAGVTGPDWRRENSADPAPAGPGGPDWRREDSADPAPAGPGGPDWK